MGVESVDVSVRGELRRYITIPKIAAHTTISMEPIRPKMYGCQQAGNLVVIHPLYPIMSRALGASHTTTRYHRHDKCQSPSTSPSKFSFCTILRDDGGSMARFRAASCMCSTPTGGGGDCEAVKWRTGIRFASPRMGDVYDTNFLWFLSDRSEPP
jgi:hypothetical protein